MGTLVKFAVAASLLYVVIAILAYWQQERLFYPAPPPSAEIPAGFELATYATEDGLELSAGYRASENGTPTLLYFHGNGADWQSSAAATDRLTAERYGVLAAEYRGYGGNPGTPGEQGFYADGRAAIAFLAAQGVSPANIVLVGNSIGSGTAVQIATEIDAKALVLISPFANLRQLVGEKIAWLPTSLLLRDTYDNVGKIGAVEEPVLILHGDVDTLIPLAHSTSLERAQPEAKLVEFAGIGHELAWNPEAQRAMLDFLGGL